MENGLLDRVEGNANVHRWSEQTQLEKGYSIAAEYMSELSDYTRISVTQNNLQELKEIWNQWGNETKQLFYGNYRDLPYLLDIQVDEHLFRALAQFWNLAYSCFTFGEVDLVPTVEEYTALLRCPRYEREWITARIKEKGEYKCISWDALKGLILTHPDETKRVVVFALSLYGLMVFPRALGYVDEATTDLFHRLGKRVTYVPAILAETFRSLGTCRKAGAGRFVGCAQLLLAWFYSHFRLIDKVFCRVFFEDYSPLKDIVASTRRVDVPKKNWIALLQNFQAKDVEWRAPWIIPGEILYRCGSFDWVPPLEIWGAIGYAPLLVLRGADYKKKVGEISNAWNKTCRLKGIAISPATTPEYIEWRGRRVNDKIPKPNVEGARPVEEYLRVMPSELEIMRQEFERKNLELEKKITKLEEEKMYLSLDVDVQKKERARVGGSSDQLRKEVQEGRARAEYWERKFQEMQSQNLALEEESKGLKTKVALHDGELRVEQLKAQEDYLKGELHQARGQVEERDYVIGEAIAQIREVAEYVQDLAIRADVLSLMYSSSSDVGRELALLLDRVKALGLRVKAYL
ncbi:hypothetical protein CXB51_008341 [Gossypium anomalum]|uniref:DUF7745 domain-containing protein n=1 Tax=Gossypium anomalum TaxID=47600 RepID=A0A8J6D6P9_9ROSI|nr:hypothetical protein CXB51_008341 [Gossypium anomalum]